MTPPASTAPIQCCAVCPGLAFFSRRVNLCGLWLIHHQKRSWSKCKTLLIVPVLAPLAPLISAVLRSLTTALPLSPPHPLVDFELPGQLAFKTSSSKKRKLSRPQPRDQDPLDSPSPDSVLPSCEVDDDPALSFSATSVASGLDTPSYIRNDSLPASSLPPRLQNQGGSLVSADYASSAASSPCASAYAELSLESDKGGDETGPPLSAIGSQVLLSVSQRAVMNGDSDLHHRSSSPLKRRASSMDPENDAARNRDIEMATSQVTNGDKAPESSVATLPRAMSVDPPESSSLDNGSAERKR